MDKKRCFFISIILGLSACGGGGGSSSPPISPAIERIQISGAGDLGIFDPAITRDPSSGRLWMSYSSIETSIYYPSATYWAVSIRLAFSDDNGTNWTDAGSPVAPAVQTLVGPMTENHPSGSIPANSQGIWQSETSALIYDPGAVPAERWKLIWFQYLNANLTSFFADHSWIAMKTAATPAGLLAATPVKLFGGAGLQADGGNTGAPVFSPIGGTPAIQLNTDLSNALGGADLNELNLCIFTEPGLHATNSAIYLSIYCADAATMPTNPYLVHFRCSSPCNVATAASWEYAGRLLTPGDALSATGNDFFQAPALVAKGAATYLLVTPVDANAGERYNGCRAYRFVSIDSNQLVRSGGQLTEFARIDGDSGTHNGACAGLDGIDGGLYLSQFEASSSPQTFKLYKSQEFLP